MTSYLLAFLFLSVLDKNGFQMIDEAAEMLLCMMLVSAACWLFKEK